MVLSQATQDLLIDAFAKKAEAVQADVNVGVEQTEVIAAQAELVAQQQDLSLAQIAATESHATASNAAFAALHAIADELGFELP